VVGEDLAELACDLIATEHLASVVADDEPVARDGCRHRGGIVGVAAVDQAAVELADFLLKRHLFSSLVADRLTTLVALFGATG
jgi:hypothetical protein